MHLNALYDIMNRRYIDAVLQDSRNENEHSALISMLENIGHESIIVADRGYESYNTIAHLENNGLKYVMRIKTSGGIAQKFNIPHNEETDFTADIIITRRQTNEVKANPELYRHIPAFSNFDFLPKGSKDTYPLKFRIIRLRISEDNYETIVTNLCDDEFSAEDIKMIYKMRWGIETSFRELKYQVGLIAFHSKKKRQILRMGDTLVIKELDRLSRNKADIKRELEEFKTAGVRVKILDIPTTLTDFPPDQAWILEMINSILIEVLGSIAENERIKIRSRQREGIEAAKKKNVRFGWPPKSLPHNWQQIMADVRSENKKPVEAIRELGISRSYFYKLYSDN